MKPPHERPKSPIPKEEVVESRPPSLRRLEDVTQAAEFLDAVDFKALNEVLDRLSEQGNGRTIENWTKREDVRIHEELESVDGYMPTGRTHILMGNIELSWSTVVRSREHTPGLEALHTLIHETVHKRSYKNIQSNGDFGIINSGLRELHVRRTEGGLDVEKVIGLSLDEAVTEEIALDVMTEYLRRTGNSHLLKLWNESESDSITGVYAADRVILTATVTALSEKLGVDEDTMWRSIARSYLSGEGGVRELLAIISEEFEGGITNASALLMLDTPLPNLNENRELLDDLMQTAREATIRALNRLKPEHVSHALRLS